MNINLGPKSYPFSSDDLYSPQGFEGFDADEEAEEDMLKQADAWSYSERDAIPDEAFEEAQLFAHNSPFIRRQVDADKIENITVKIFTHLYEVVDQVERKEVESAMTPHFSPSPSPFNSPKQEDFSWSESKDLRPYSRDTNFYEESNLEQPLRIQNVVTNILSSAAYIFFGWDPLNERGSKTPQEMQDILSNDRLLWKDLKAHYFDFFQVKMDTTFNKAELLLKSRIEDQQWAFIQRITLYASLTFATIGKIKNNNMVLVLGLSASAITVISMITHHGTTSFKQAQQGDDLRQSIELATNLKIQLDNVYEMAANHRRPSELHAQ